MNRARRAHRGGRPWSPSAQVCRGAESAVSGAPTPTQAGDPPETWSRWPTPAPAALPRPAPQGPPLHDSPGPAQVAPSVGLRAREPSSPRGLLIDRPPSPPSSQQPRDANRRSVLGQQRRGSRQALRAGRRQPRPPLPGSCAGGAGGGARDRGRGQGPAPGRGEERAARGEPGGLGERKPSPCPHSVPPVGKGPAPRAPRRRHTPGVKTSQSFNLHKFQGAPSALPSPGSLGPQSARGATRD